MPDKDKVYINIFRPSSGIQNLLLIYCYIAEGYLGQNIQNIFF